MAKPKLIVSDAYQYDHFYICWLFPEEGEEGAALGESVYTEKDLAKATSEDWDDIKATLVAGKTPGAELGDHGYTWETAAKAKVALKIINLALKDKTGKMWPDWALAAKANGWTPPKGWTP